MEKNTIAIVTDGSAILGLGNQGPLAALPVMEAKAVLFKELAGLNAVPLVLNTQKPNEIVKIIKAISSSFGGINIEDIAAPNCFLIKEKLKKELDIPVFHDDQYGTAIAVLAGLINAAKVAKKDLKNQNNYFWSWSGWNSNRPNFFINLEPKTWNGNCCFSWAD